MVNDFLSLLLPHPTFHFLNMLSFLILVFSTIVLRTVFDISNQGSSLSLYSYSCHFPEEKVSDPFISVCKILAFPYLYLSVAKFCVFFFLNSQWDCLYSKSLEDFIVNEMRARTSKRHTHSIWLFIWHAS